MKRTVSNSELGNFLESIGFEVDTHIRYKGDTNCYLDSMATGNFTFTDSTGTTRGIGLTFTDPPTQYTFEWFNLKNGGLIFKFSPTNTVDHPFVFCAIENDDNSISYLFRSSEFNDDYVYFDDGTGNPRVINMISGQNASNANIALIGQVFDQDSSFLTDVYYLITSPSLAFNSTYIFELNGTSYACGMSRATSDAGKGARLCFAIED